VSLPQPVERDERDFARMTGVPCVHRGEPAKIEGKPIVRPCGCVSQKTYTRVFHCELLGCLCQTRGGSVYGDKVDGVKVIRQNQCREYAPAGQGESEGYLTAEQIAADGAVVKR
jgi:hypothetical protein